VMGDITSIHQVLMNLATNAAHAMPDGGSLDIAVEPLYVRDSAARQHPSLSEGSYAVLKVQDTGRGIDPAMLDRVFEPFFTTKPPGEGSGLGLAMVHGIMRDHGGAVLLDSEVDRGTVVRCLFPAVVEGSFETGLVDPSTPRGKGEHILVIDDEPPLASLSERRLTALGYRVTIATDPRKAITAFKAAPSSFNMVITDYSMPHMSGIELAREINALRPDLPILLVTGFVEDFSQEELATAGVRRVVTKPVTTHELARATSESLR